MSKTTSSPPARRQNKLLSGRVLRGAMFAVFGNATAAIYLAQMNTNPVVRAEVMRVITRYLGL